MGLSRLMRHQMAEVYRGRVIADLIHEYRWFIRAVGTSLFVAILGSIALYKLEWARSNDWRPLALAFGAGIVVPIAVIFCVLPRARFAEFWVASAAKESARPWVATLIFVLCVMALVAGIVGSLFD